MSFIEEYKRAYTIRKVEEFFLDMFKLGKISGTVHTCVGQEFSGVFASKYSQDGDYVVSNHRGHGHYLAAKKNIKGLIAEIMGKTEGLSGGFGGSQHLADHNFLTNDLQSLQSEGQPFFPTHH